MKYARLALALAASAVPHGLAIAQPAAGVPQLAGATRLDVSATGEVNRVPDVANISAGVVTRAQTAMAAIDQNAQRMERVIAALKRAGIAERDIQTSTISLNPEYHYAERQPPQLTGYQATNMVTVRFRDIRATGRILDALVAEGANQIHGPSFSIDKPEQALDEARVRALAVGRERADLYARALGKRVVRLISVSEGGGHYAPPQPPGAMADAAMAVSRTEIVPGEQKLQVSLAMSFEIQ